MIAAIGYNTSTFFPSNPDRLCRGRERWIDSSRQDGDGQESSSLHRIVISGACFQDDSARNAMRGIRCANITNGDLIRSLFDTETIVSWAEDANPKTVPSQASGVELSQRATPFGPVRTWFARYEVKCDEIEDINVAIAGGADVFLINPVLRKEDEDVSVITELPPQHGETSNCVTS